MSYEAPNDAAPVNDPEISPVDRPELEPILRALSPLAHNQQDRWLFALTGFPGSGKHTAIVQLIRQAQTQTPAIPTLCYAVPDLITHANDSIYHAITILLQAIAKEVGAQLEEPPVADQNPPGEATLKQQVRTLHDQWRKSRRPLFLALEASDASKETRLFLRVLERVLFTRLVTQEAAHRPNVPIVVVIAGNHELRWSDLTPSVTPVPLQPFTAGQTAQQLGISLPQAQAVLAASGGLPAANRLLWADGRLAALPLPNADNGLSDPQPHAWPPAQPLFEQVFQQFVAPFLGQDALLADAVKATALLNEHEAGFNVTELAQALQTISYMQGRYTPSGKAAYYGEIDRMYGLGLISPGDDGRFRLEPHLQRLLDLWNQYTHPVEDAANRTRMAQIRTDLAAATRSGVLATRPTAEAATPTAPVPLTNNSAPAGEMDDLGRIYERIVNDPPPRAEEDESGIFVGREGVREQIANYLCRQTTEEVDIVFLQGSAGSGKTAVLGHFLAAARAAVKQARSSGHNPLLITTQLYAKVDNSTNEDPDYENPIPGLIDLEYSLENRFGSIRRMLRYAIVDGLVEEQLQLSNRSIEDLGEPELKRLRDEQKVLYFADYRALEKKWEGKREEIRNSKPDRWKTIQQQRDVIAKLQHDLDQAFLKACRKVAESRKTAERRRILVVFDTFDYPVRSGVSARRFVSQVAAYLAGDYFFLIACRPPITPEEIDPYIDGNIRNYLPDDLRDRAMVIDLDAPAHSLTVENVLDFYRGQKWYKAAAEITFQVGDNNLVVGNRDDLVLELAHLFFRQDSLPVLLSLLEYYVGVHDGHNEGRLTNDPEELSTLTPEVFGDEMMDGLLRYKLSGLILDSDYKAALLLMGVIDRRVSQRLLCGFSPDPPKNANPDRAGAAPERITGIGEELAKRTADPMWQADGIWKALQELEGSTLVKVLPSTMNKRAYKLHDYVVTLFDHYVKTQPAFEHPLLKQREHILFAVLVYMNALAKAYGPDFREGDEESLRIYQAARSVFLYYAVRLAAVQYDNEKAHRRPIYELLDIDSQINGEMPQNEQSAQSIAAPLDGKLTREQRVRQQKLNEFLATPDAIPGKLAVFLSQDLLDCLEASIYEGHPVSADKTAKLVFGYLLGKVVREVSQHMEYGLAQMLLQDARYYLHSQSTTSRPLFNLTLPLLNYSDNNDPRGRFATARRLYYAAVLTWEHASRQYATADPWLAKQYPGTSHLREWRPESEWRAICALLQLDEWTYEGSQRVYQRHFADWLKQAGYIRQAHDAYALLARHADGEEYVSLLLNMANIAIDNPLHTRYHMGEGRFDSRTSGLDAARRYLDQALEVCIDPTQRIKQALISEVHHTFGYLYRILDRLDWRISPIAHLDSSTGPADRVNVIDAAMPGLEEYADWGATRHYEKAMVLLERSTEVGDRLQYAIALNGYSYVLAILGQVDLASVMCKAGIDLLTKLYNPLVEGDGLYQDIRDALGRAYSTSGEIGWYLARRPQMYDEKAVINIQVYEDSLRSYDQARAFFGDQPANWEWYAKLDVESSNIEFWLAAESKTEEAQQNMFAVVTKMRQSIRSLLDKDRPDAYRRFGVMLLHLVRLNMILPDQHSSWQYESATDEFMPLEELNQFWRTQPTATQAYVTMLQGYNAAIKIKNQRYKILFTQDTVDLLAASTNVKTVDNFYRHRLTQMGVTKRQAIEPIESEMMGRAELAIGFAFLREAEAKKRTDDLKAAQAMSDPATSHIIEGFDRINVRSVGDQVRLLKDITQLRVFLDLDLFHYTALTKLYSNLSPRNFGPQWRDLIEAINWRIVREHAKALPEPKLWGTL